MNSGFGNEHSRHLSTWAAVSKSLIDDLDANDTQTDYDQSSIIAPSELHTSDDEFSEFDEEAEESEEEDGKTPIHACRLELKLFLFNF